MVPLVWRNWFRLLAAAGTLGEGRALTATRHATSSEPGDALARATQDGRASALARPITVPIVRVSIVLAALYSLLFSSRPTAPGPLEIGLTVMLAVTMALSFALPRRRFAWWMAQVSALIFIFGSMLINFSLDGRPVLLLLWLPWLAIIFVQNASAFQPRTALLASGAVFVAALGVMALYTRAGLVAPGMPVFDAMVLMALFHLTLIVMLYNVTRRGAFEITGRVRAEAALENAEARARIEGELSAARLNLAQADRSLSVSALAETIAHEIKQPLTAITASAQAALNWLRRDGPQIAEAAACSERILADVERAGDIVVSARDLIRRERGVRAPVDIAGLIVGVATMLREEAATKGVTLSAQAAEGLPLIAADAGQIRQLVVNLVLNAMEASRASPRGARPVFIRAAAAQGAVVLSVEDRGAGFPPGGDTRAFEAFFTTKPGGIGLGLAICKTIAEAHDGTIAAETLAKGARVSVTLPAAQP